MEREYNPNLGTLVNLRGDRGIGAFSRELPAVRCAGLGIAQRVKVA
jgi:hypothetical protein